MKINFPFFLLNVYRDNCIPEKKLILLLSLFIICLASAHAQLRSELNLPRVGDELMKEQVTYFESGESGENQIWDFSKIKSVDDVCIFSYFTRDDWKITSAEKGKLSFLYVSGDSLLLSGYENPNNLVRYSQSGLLLSFPIVYGATSQGRFQGRGKHNDRLESIVSGEIQTSADAAGIIILPGNDTLENVIRLHIRKVEKARYIPISSGFDIDEPANDSLFLDCKPDIIITETYQWYEEGYRYPILETVETYSNTATDKIVLSSGAYFYHPADHAFLPEDEANRLALERQAAARKVKMLEKESNILSFNCFPNPVKIYMTIELNLHRAANIEISLFDMNGRLAGQLPSKTDVKHYKEILNMQSFPSGNYLLKVSAGKETISEKIIKN